LSVGLAPTTVIVIHRISSILNAYHRFRCSRLISRTILRVVQLDKTSLMGSRSKVWSGLDLHLIETVLPDDDIGGDAILTVVQHDDQAIDVHGLASIELEVLEVGDKSLLDVFLGALLESRDGVGIGTLLLELRLDGLHVALEVAQVGFLVERSRLETERVDNVVDLLGAFLEGLLGLLGGSVGTDVNVSSATNGDHGAVTLVDDIIDQLDRVRVREDLIASEEILEDFHVNG
jgi:hypothetical protein